MQKLKLNKKLLTLGFALLLPVSLASGIGLLSSPKTAKADEVVAEQYTESITITNSNFTSGANPTASGELQGWSIIEKDHLANGMIIDVSDKNWQNSYYVDTPPGKIGKDDKILMINSKSSTFPDGSYINRGYRSQTITLKANSYYKLCVKALTANNGSDGKVFGSIYVSGLKDENDKDVTLAHEGITNKSWANYYFYIATADQDQEVTLDLYLGSKTLASDGGVVFYDDVTLEQFSQNFYVKDKAIIESSFDYAPDGSITEKYVTSVALKSTSSNIDMDGYNFNFEETVTSSDTLSPFWDRLSTGTNLSQSHAMVTSISQRGQASQFTQTTGYPFAGSNFTDGNSKALVLYTNPGQSSFFGVESKDIEIKAHGLYKISAYVKVTEMTEGGFYIQVKENDKIYDFYKLTSDDYTLASQTSSSISAKGTDKFINEYQIVDFYIKGHEFFDTSVNIQLLMGSADAPASGCVFVDDITLSYVDYKEFSNGSNKLELSTISSTPTFTNGFFNDVENEESALTYPLKASGWTLNQNENDYITQEAGVVYLHNEAKFNEMYGDKLWGAYPKHPSTIDAPNNAFMFYNGNSTYQSLTSSSFALEKNSVYELSFDYFTRSTAGKDAALTIEVVDENGILLFKKSNFKSEVAETWVTGEKIYFKTAEHTSYNANIIIHFGEKDDKMEGVAYIDNFKIKATSTESVFETAKNKVDMTNYFLKLDVEDSADDGIHTSSAYNFNIDTIYTGTNPDAAKGGIIRGTQNRYNIEVEDSDVLMLSSAIRSLSSITSAYKFATESGNYYKLTFDLQTRFNNSNGGKTDSHDCEYGVQVGLSDFEIIKGLVSEDEFTTYTIYFKADSAKASQFKFALNSDCDESLADAFLTHISFTASSEDEYNRAKEVDSYNKTVFTTTETSASDDDNDDDTTDSNQPASTGDNSIWLVIPAVIFAIAIIVALAGYGIRHIKFKKTEKVREESYNRRISVDHDLTLKEAQAERDAEVASLNETKANLVKQKEEAEIAHKEAVKEARVTNKGKITKESEREFKAYANKISRLQEKIDIINEQIETALSPDHLMEIEKRIADDEIRRMKELRKESRADRK